MWQLIDNTGRKNVGYFRIMRDGVRVADVFPYAPDVNAQWVIAQAQRIVDAMNAIDTATDDSQSKGEALSPTRLSAYVKRGRETS